MRSSANTSLAIFDPHLHLFDLQQGEYAWLKELNDSQQAIIAKDFCVNDLHLSVKYSLAGFVHIEAGFDNEQPWHELAAVEQSLKQNREQNTEQKDNIAFGSIASVDLLQPPEIFALNLARLQEYSSFVGVRHILNEQAVDILAEPNAKQNLALLNRHGLVFELQIVMHYTHAENKQKELLNALIDTFSPLSNLRIVLNHAGFMPIQNHSASASTPIPLSTEYKKNYEYWQNDMRTLAELEHLYVKCSGWEMTNLEYTHLDVERGLSFLLATFGQARLMLASNFPLVLYAKSYAEYWQFMAEVVLNINADFEALSYTNSKRLYLEPLV